MKRLGQIETIAALIFSAIFIPGISSQTVAQTVAIGHISAEVVESVSASSNMQMSFNLPNGTPSGRINASNMNTRSVEMGDVSLNSGRGIACNVMMKSSTLSDANGNSLVLEPVTTINGNQDTSRADGSQKLRVTANMMLAQNQANGLYQGSYTMIFAYN